jgi:hypothetical protein
VAPRRQQALKQEQRREELPRLRELLQQALLDGGQAPALLAGEQRPASWGPTPPSRVELARQEQTEPALLQRAALILGLRWAVRAA